MYFVSQKDMKHFYDRLNIFTVISQKDKAMQSVDCRKTGIAVSKR